MEVALLHPQDCLKRHHHHYNKPRRSPNPNPNPTRSNRKRRNSPPPSSGPAQAQLARAKSPSPGPQVRILKRGENLSPPKPAPESTQTFPLNWPGPMVDGFYAGSACVTSPPPSELPLPAFFSRRTCGLELVGEDHNQKIASDLRRVLKLC